MKLKKIITMGLAAIMAVSAMSISAFATEDGNTLLATVSTENGEIVEVYKSDVENGGYVVDCGSYTVTIDGELTTASSMAADSIQSTQTGSFLYYLRGISTSISGFNDWNLSFSNGYGVTSYTPHVYTPASGYSSIKYQFLANSAYGDKVYAQVYSCDSDGSSASKLLTMYFADGDTHNVSVNSMTSGTDYTYATIYSKKPSVTATGTCAVTN